MRGRPPRWQFERQRTRLWSESVRYEARTSFRTLEGVLGSDGRWNGLWSRYSRGVVSPTSERVMRIDNKLSGTAKYYFCPFWKLIENRDYTRKELDDCVQWLQPSFRNFFMTNAQSVFGSRWRNHMENSALLPEAVRLVTDIEFGLDAVTAILIAVREAELIQDSRAYLRAIKAWAEIEADRNKHFVLRYLSPYILDSVAEPLRHMRFEPTDIDCLWRQHVENYCEKRSTNIDRFEVLDCIFELPI